MKLKNYSNIHVVSTPWVERKNFIPLIPHRLGSAHNIYPKDLSKILGYNYSELKNLDELPALDKDDYVLIGGAGIIKKEIADTKKVINSHPAYLAHVRGLDSFKWAILNDKPIGVTSHIISEEADQGWLIKKKHVPLFSWDTFHSVANRQYEMEIDMLASAVEDLENASLESLTVEGVEVSRRMPHKMELEMIKKFDSLIKNQTT
jgi:phosphoribosylglycinamide formyltransferase-1